MSFVPPPPPGVVVPAPPEAAPSSSAAVLPAKVVKPGGVALDMSNLFGPPKTGARKSLPPWERKEKTPPPGAPAAAVSDDLPAPPPPQKPSTASKSPLVPGPPTQPFSSGMASKLVFKSTAETSCSSLSSLPAPPVGTGGTTIAAAAAAAVTSPPSSSVTSPPAVVPVQTSTSSASPPVSNPALSAVPVNATPTATTVAAPVSADVVPLTTHLVNAAASPQQHPADAATAIASVLGGSAVAAVPPVLPGNDPAVLSASANIVKEALRDMCAHLAAPSRTVVAPHVVFQEKAQTLQVMPLGPVPPKKIEKMVGKSKAAAAVTAPSAPFSIDSSSVWYNKYDLQPSPSFQQTHRHSHSAAVSIAGAKSTKHGWRGAYFQNVDVHRYIARRYFGDAPPVEH